MLRDLTLGQYLPGDTPVHRLDPRAKLGACLVLMAAVFAPGGVGSAVAAWPLLALGIGLSRVPLGYFLRGLRPFGWLFAFTLALHALTTPGRALVEVPGGRVPVTAEGVVAGLDVAARLATAIAYSSLLTLTTNPLDLVWAFEWAARPLERVGVPVGEVGISLLMAIRFVPILQREAERLGVAVRARGIELDRGPLRERVRALRPLLIPLFRQVFLRADSLALALEVRGYRPGVRRVPWRARGLGVPEWIALGLCAATVAAAWIAGWGVG